MYNEIGKWVLTDDDIAQYRRRLPDVGGAPVFELTQVNQYGDDLFRVAHGRIYLGFDVSKEQEDFLLDTYGIDREEFASLPETDRLGQLAEMSFETWATEYDLAQGYRCFEDARQGVLGIVNMKVK